MILLVKGKAPPVKELMLMTLSVHDIYDPKLSMLMSCSLYYLRETMTIG